jgi:hypothetical protein
VAALARLDECASPAPHFARGLDRGLRYSSHESAGFACEGARTASRPHSSVAPGVQSWESNEEHTERNTVYDENYAKPLSREP